MLQKAKYRFTELLGTSNLKNTLIWIDANLGMYGFLEALRNTSGNENQGVDTEVGWYKFFSSR